MHSRKNLSFTLLGPESSGKTTLLACIARLLKDTETSYVWREELTIAYRKLKEAADVPDWNLTSAIEAAEELKQYNATQK